MSSNVDSTSNSDSDASRRLSILQVNTFDVGGGAEQVAMNLLRSYRSRGHGSWLAVGFRRSAEGDILEVPNNQERNPWTRAWGAFAKALEPVSQRRRWLAPARRVSLGLARPLRAIDREIGREDFGFPGTWRIPELAPEPISILHGHNLHGAYFDLRALPSISHKVPTVLTLHDAWLLSGHCAHSFGCERWLQGCGSCPDLTIYPAVRRDSTAYNWRRKQQIFARSALYVATPSEWLMNKVRRSMLGPSLLETRVIPNGVDLAVFRPGDRLSARQELGIPAEAAVLLFAAHGIRANPWKDFEMLRRVLQAVAERTKGRHLLFVALGEEAPTEQVGSAELRFAPFRTDATATARYYQAADVYVHAARADTFPNTVLEALACGTPVVATAVGGIPEQIIDGRTGFLVPPGDVDKMTEAVLTLLDDASLRASMSANATEDAALRFGLDRQVDAYLNWYRQILEDRVRHRESAGTTTVA
jgi:glycosyltransferase involved in cell wall biosynthesis